MIDVHAGHHRTIRVEHVHRIQPAAQPDFEDGDIHLVRNETLHGGQRAEFEIGERNIAAHLLDLRKRRTQLGITCLLFGDTHPFVVVQQMRRGIAADAVSGGMQDGFQHRAHRALAVGAADDDDGKIRLKIQPLFDLRHALQTERDGFGMQGF